MIYDLLASVGLMFILKYGSILTWYRDLGCRLSGKICELHKCSLCLGFWTGFIIMWFEIYFENFNHKIIMLPLISSGCCWFIDNLNNVLQSIEIKLDRDLEK